MHSQWRHRSFWMACFTYTLFVCSLFSKAGISASIILLYGWALYHRWRTPVEERLPAWLWLPPLVLLGWGAFSALAGDQPLEGLRLMMPEYRLLVPLALVPALAAVRLPRLLGVYMVGVALMGLYAIAQYHWGVDWLRPFEPKHVTPMYLPGHEGVVYHARGNYTHLSFGEIMLMTVPIYTALALWSRTPRRAGWLVGAAGGALGVLFSMARSSWLGMGAGLVALAVRVPRRVALPVVAGFLALLLITAVAVSSGWLRAELSAFRDIGVVQRLRVTSPTRDVERLYLWRAGVLGIKERPLVGHGLNHPEPLERFRRIVAKEVGGFKWTSVAPIIHNSYLEVAFYLGIPGLLVYLWLWGALLVWNLRWAARGRHLLPFESALLTGITGAFAGILVESFLNHTFFEMEVQTALVMWMGLSYSAGLRIRAAWRDQAGGAAA